MKGRNGSALHYFCCRMPFLHYILPSFPLYGSSIRPKRYLAQLDEYGYNE
ncbi:hypothetical protein [Rossellomorea marisflavi]|nr:hypothetical protein [Rossellomorea marisflavi]MCM2604390.1 hypothetical protein [Rossellomorea marisflavi]